MNTILSADVSKDRLDLALVFRGGEVHRLQAGNDVAGFEAALRWAKGLCKRRRMCVAMESSGRYHKAFLRFVAERGLKVHELNAYQVRELANGIGILRKSDQSDALVIAKYVLAAGPAETEGRSELHDRLRDVSRRIEKLTNQLSDLRKEKQAPSLAEEAVGSLVRQEAFLRQEIRRLEKTWVQLIKGDEALSANYRCVLTVPGIGKKTARVLVSELPADCSRYTTKQLAAYAGVVPHENQSGATRRASTIRRTGNGHIRRALYMPAVLMALVHGTEVVRYTNLLERGQRHNQAIVAIMHKLIRRAAAVLRRRSPWRAAAS